LNWPNVYVAAAASSSSGNLADQLKQRLTITPRVTIKPWARFNKRRTVANYKNGHGAIQQTPDRCKLQKTAMAATSILFELSCV
jgi:hypothetical protein